MDYTFILISAAICLVVGYFIARQIPYIARFAIISLAAGALTALGLLSTTGKIIEYNMVASSAASLSSTTVSKVCGHPDIHNTFCYQQAEYRGFPLRAVQINYTSGRAPVISAYSIDGHAGSGLFIDYMFYLMICIVIVVFLQKVAAYKNPSHN